MVRVNLLGKCTLAPVLVGELVVRSEEERTGIGKHAVQVEDDQIVLHGETRAACVVRAALGMRSGARLAATARLAVAATTAAAGLVGGSSLATAGAAGPGAVCATAGKGVGGVTTL